MNYLPTNDQPTQVKVATITKTNMSFLNKSLIVFTGLIAVISTITVFGDKGLDESVANCNAGYPAACIYLMNYQSRWDQITSDYGNKLIEDHYNSQL